MKWIVWGILLIIQNFSFVAVSRARNSGSITLHAIASLFSNGIWFASMFIIVDSINAAIRNASAGEAVFLGLFYTTFTLTGSIVSHYVMMRWIEPRVNRKTGS
jgi:hypothetical protein